MSYILIKSGGDYVAANHKEFLIESTSDVSSLPGLSECAPGSTATIIGGNVYMLSIAGTWKKATTPTDVAVANLATRVSTLEELHKTDDEDETTTT